MDFLFSPWRYRYVTGARDDAGEECVLCAKLKQGRDADNLVLHRGSSNAVMLNLFPYTCGHLMILPFDHQSRLKHMPASTRGEMMALAAASEEILQTVFRPDGLNMGMNLGAAAGAGIAGHIHFHVLPRWQADSNFITVIGETRVLPESLEDTYRRLLPHFAKL